MAGFVIVAAPTFGRSCTHRLAGKLDPLFFPAMPPEFAAIVGFVLDTGYTRPTVCEILLEAGFVVVVCGDEKQALLSYESLRANWLELLSAAGLTPEDRMDAECTFAARIGRPDLEMI